MRFDNPLRPVVLTLKTGSLIKGLLIEENRRSHMMMRMASVSSQDRNGMEIWTRIEGDVVVLKDNLEYYQLLSDTKALDLPPM